MPYHIEKIGNKFQVITTATGEPHSKKGMTKKAAEAQLRILNAHMSVVEHLGGAIFGLPSQKNTDASSETNANSYMLTGANTLITPLPLTLLGLATGKNYDIIQHTDTEALYNKKNEEDANRYYAQQEAYYKSAEYKKQQDLLRNSEIDAQQVAQAKLDKSGVNKVYTDAEIDAAIRAQELDQRKQLQAKTVYNLTQANLNARQNASRTLQANKNLQTQQQQAQQSLTDRLNASKNQFTSVKDSLTNARQIQQRQIQDNQLFKTKADQIRQEDFFNQDRIAQQAKQSLVEAEQRRQALKASATQQQQQQQVQAPALQTTRRLPPSILWHQ
jgi:hypothetical protein